MSRPPPQISSAQKQNLSSLSRAQIRDKTTQRELVQSFVKSKEELDKNTKMLARHYTWSARYGHWFARVALLPVFVLAIGMIFVVVSGLWTGEIKELQKYSKLHVYRISNPIAYWVSVVYHCALAAFTNWIGVIIFRAAKFGKKKAN